jgi:hypothetical protein
MIMVLLAGFSTAVSIYFLYRNKNNIGYEIMKYYTYLDEYFASTLCTEDSKIIYYNDLKVTECLNVGNMVRQLDPTNNFFITHDFIVKENEDKSKPNINKNLYTIFLITNSESTNENIDKEKNNLWKYINNVYYDIRYNESKDLIEETIFNNKMENYESNMNWKCPIIGCSITITDKDNIFNYKDYDITNFICGLCRKDKQLVLDNNLPRKRLWILIFNYLFQSNNVYIQPEMAENLNIDWTIITETGMIHQGMNLKIDF